MTNEEAKQEAIKTFDVEMNNGNTFQVKEYCISGMWFGYVDIKNKKQMIGLPHIKSVKLDGKEQKIY